MNVLDDIRDFAREQPRQPAVISGSRGEAPDEIVDYETLVARFDQRAQWLREAGVERGQRCGLVARQGCGFIEAALAILATDACFVHIPDGTDGAALDQAARESSLHHLLEEDSGFELQSFSGVAPVDGQEDRAFRALRPAYLRFTSGTTSERKGVIVGHDAVAARLANANQTLKIDPEDRVMWLLPMAHHFLVSILLYLRNGATVLLPPSNFAADVLDFANRHSATVFYASPYHYGLLAKDESELGLGAARLAISTADGLREEDAERFKLRFGKPLVQALGIIEVGLPVINVASAAVKPEALGRVGEAYDIWLREEEGSRIDPEASSPTSTGEICIRGSGLFDAYLKPWILAAELLEPDGFRTGDQGWFDTEGDLHLAGRRSNRINMAGMKFFAEEVEAVLDAHPGIEASRVFAKEHPHLGQIPVAEFVASDGGESLDRRMLAAHCKQRLPPYKIPREFKPVAALALTETGKLKRN
ncbi:MAG: class I adenylate-forming enzyme family protein [Myxococcota bacterium]|nr:class I adenylate-forming enzyme family protein [Myxococcota bacterium]